MSRVAVATPVTPDRLDRLAGARPAMRAHLPGALAVVAVMAPGHEMDDAVRRARRAAGEDALLVPVPHGPSGRFRLAAARNAALDAAADTGAELLLALDVDCVPGAGLAGELGAVPEGAVALGAVTYLPAAAGEPEPSALAGLTDPHPAREFPPTGHTRWCATEDYERYFWSLCFALRPGTWRTLRARGDGFDEGYVGYGAEDTDFGRRLAAADVPLLLVGGAHAYHRHHPPTRLRPEVLDDLLRNGERYARRWGRWPMEGWFRELEQQGRVRRTDSGWARRTDSGWERVTSP